MQNIEEINVHIGEVKLRVPGFQLQAILGSCVGIAIIDRKRDLCTLSHSLVPFSEKRDARRPGRSVSLAIEVALSMLKVEPARYKRLEAVIAGGGSMISEPQPHRVEVGQANVEKAIEVLTGHRIPIIHQQVGGQLGRKFSISPETLDYTIVDIPRLTTSGAAS